MTVTQLPRPWAINSAHDCATITVFDSVSKKPSKVFRVCCEKAVLSHEGCTCSGVTSCPDHGFRHNFRGEEKHP